MADLKKVKKIIIKKNAKSKLLSKLKIKSKLKPKPKPKLKPKPKSKLNAKLKPKKETEVKLKRFFKNPIIDPGQYSWESQAVFNPAVVLSDGRVHLFYRALGPDGISRIGYTSSSDGINFDDRLTYPVFFIKENTKDKKHYPYTTPISLTYDTGLYASGGGWGGCEDPRAVMMDGRMYLTFNIFNGWNSMLVAVTSINKKDLFDKKWLWNELSYLSHPGDRQKNWVLFPEKIHGKFAIFHNLDMGDPNRVGIVYVDRLDYSETPEGKDAPDPQLLPDHIVAWHYRTRSASAPPIKTKDGWLLLYHAMDKNDPTRYKLGAMLLDLKDPRKVLYRAQNPILEADEWYENDWKPGIIYGSGAIVRNGRLMVYYGGGDKYIAMASIKLSDLIKSMKENTGIKLQKDKLIALK